MVSLDPEISILLWVWVSSKATSGSGCPATSPNVLKKKWKTLNIQNGSKNWINNSTFLGLSVCRLDTFFPETFGPRYHNRVPFSMFYWMVCLMTTPAVLLPCSLQAPIRHIPSSSPVPAQLPSFCPVLLYSAHASAPLLLCSSPAPALLLVLPTPVWQPSSSSSAPYDFFRHGESRLLW